MAKKKGEWDYFERKLPDLPTVTPIDESIHILEETVAVLQLKIAELKARQKPYHGRVEPLVHPRTGRVHNGKYNWLERKEAHAKKNKTLRRADCDPRR